MKILDPKVLLAGASLVLVGLLAFRDFADPGPGPLHPVHGAMPELAGRGGCVLCHGASGTPAAMMDGCLTCHDAIDEQLRVGAGLHGQLRNADQVGEEVRCDQCHGEHHGGSLALVGDLAFVRAGFASLGGFDHDGLDFGLVGAHADLGCIACHENAEVEVLPMGATRFLGLESTCTHCHVDPHEGEMPATCADCHGQSEPFASVAQFKHPEPFPLRPPHAGLSCQQCHERGTLGAKAPGGIAHVAGGSPSARTCAECHRSPHAPDFLSGLSADCADCHGDGALSFQTVNVQLTRSLHAATGFALKGAHARADCASCHGVDGEFGERFPRRKAGECAACHEDVHRGAFDRGPIADGLTAREEAIGPVGCGTCHGTESFSMRAMPAFDHARWTGFALTGGHASATCASCHGEATTGPRSFGFVAEAHPGDPGRCSTCHGDVHGGAFLDQPGRPRVESSLAALGTGEVEVRQVAEDCADCHTTAGFSARGEAPFDHGRWTGYPLVGAHAEADCAGCHGPPSGKPRQFGFVKDFVKGDLRQCSTCHESPHENRFNDQRHPETGDLDCRACHTMRDFLEIRPGSFDHAAATGFPLLGAHAQAKCTVCHVPAEEALTRLGRVADHFPGNTSRCDTCHRDAHRGAFRARAGSLTAAGESATDCAACHQPTSFHITRPFEHGRWTGWTLEGSHAELECTSCHVAQAPDSLGRTHGFAAGTRCADCHVDPHLGQFRSKVGGASEDASCARCHTTVGPFSAVAFDHNSARFALDKTHADLACSACHKVATTRHGDRAVRYRPLGRECVDCHGVTRRPKDDSPGKREVPR